MQRNDLAALLLVFFSAAFVNAAWMIAPVVALEQSLLQTLAFDRQPSVVCHAWGSCSPFWCFRLLGLWMMAGACPHAHVWQSAKRIRIAEVARSYLPALLPLSFALWCAHYAFHLFTSAGTLLCCRQSDACRLAILRSLSEAAAACACCGEVARWILPLEILLLDGGLCLSLFVAYRIAEGQSRSTAAALRAWMRVGHRAADQSVCLQPYGF